MEHAPLSLFSAGAVALSLLATRHADSVTLTDLPDLLPHLRLNVSRNSGVLPAGRAHVQVMTWKGS